MNSLTGTKKTILLRFEDLASLGGNKGSFIGKFFSFFLAFSPILQHYKGPIATAGITVLVALFPFILLLLLIKFRTFRIKYFRISYLVAILPLIVFSLYKLLAHGTTFLEFAHAAVMIVYFIAITIGCINVKFFIKIATIVAATATILLIFQYVCFYILGFHLQLVSTSLFLPESDRWILSAKTGIGISGFYRPSAFFLEPSHMFIYLLPILCILLLAPDMKSWRIKMALFITLGLFLSTSGMGICVSTGLWMLYGGFYRGKDNKSRITKLFTPMNIFFVMTVPFILMILYYNVTFFNQSINRILGIDITGSDAISGRVRLAYSLVGTLTASELWFGMTGSASDIDFNLSGFFATIYKFGITGILLSYLFYINSLFKLKAQYFWLSFIIILISFFTAHTHGTFYMLYYVVILFEGYHEVIKKKYIRRQISAFQHKITQAERRKCFE